MHFRLVAQAIAVACDATSRVGARHPLAQTQLSTNDFSAVQETFRAEAEDTLDRFEMSLARLETSLSAADQREVVNDLFRYAHNLKGAAKTASFAELGEAAHVLEELLMRWRSNKLRPDAAQIAWAQAGLATLREQLIQAFAGRAKGVIHFGRRHDDHQQGAMLRVPFTALARALRTSTQSGLVLGQIEALLTQLGVSDLTLRDHLQHLGRLLVDEHEQLVKLRLKPAHELFRRLERVIQTTAKQLQKEVDVVLDGAQTEVDTSVLESLRDPLVHVVRNAVSHGIEAPALRSERGKERRGAVRIHARQEAGAFVFEVQDDGGGLDRRAIRSKAISLGLLPDSIAAEDPQVLQVIFAPGFSTAKTIDEVSGRGVGLDVVRAALDGLRAVTEIETELHEGSIFRFRIPMSLSTLQGLHVEIAEQIFVIPVADVVECIATSEMPGERDLTTRTLNVRDHALPCIRLRPLLHPDLLPPSNCRYPIVIVRRGERIVGLEVDAVRGEKRTVLVPMSTLVTDTHHLSGTTVLGNGEIGLLLNLDYLIDHHIHHAQPETLAH